jgi:hypothetical protein
MDDDKKLIKNVVCFDDKTPDICLSETEPAKAAQCSSKQTRTHIKVCTS